METIAIFNIKGGVGKTATAVNLGWLAARSGHRALIWDLDPQAAATFYFRIAAHVDGGSKGLVKGRTNVESVVRGTDFPGLDLIPSDFSYRDLDLQLDKAGKPHRALVRLLDGLNESYDVAFLDCPPSLSRLSEALFRTVDALLVPAIPTTLSIRSLQQIHEHVLATGLDDLRKLAFFTMIDRRKRLHREICSSRDVPGLEFLEAEIPYSSEVEKMGLSRAPLGAFAPRSRALVAYRHLWTELQERLQLAPGERPRTAVW